MPDPVTCKVLRHDPTKCTGCLECEKACSQVHFKTKDGGIHSALRITKKDDTYQMHVCDQRGLCIDLCAVGALTRRKTGIVTLDTKVCVGCQACVAFCPIGAMRKAPDRIQPFKCIACGSCVRACPTHALTLEDIPLDSIRQVVYHKQGV